MRRTVVAVVLAVIWITVFGYLDSISSDITFFGTLSLAAVGVSLFASARTALVVWLYAFAWNLAVGAGGGRFTEVHLLRIAISAFIGGSAVAIAFLRERREHRYEVVSDVAVVAQRALLREIPPRIDGARIAARYISAAEAALVGGDFYEAMATPQGMRIIVGDVVGRGLDAVGLAGLVLGGFREAALSSADLAELARRLDATVRAFVEDDGYATAILAEFRGREVRLVSCGHPFPLLLDGAEPPADLVLPTGLPLGYGADPVVTPRTMRAGERLLFFTDGLSEARDGRDRFFDPAVDGAAALAERDPDAALDRLLTLLDAHHGGRLQDDVALLLVEPGER